MVMEKQDNSNIRLYITQASLLNQGKFWASDLHLVSRYMEAEMEWVDSLLEKGAALHDIPSMWKEFFFDVIDAKMNALFVADLAQ
jgi:hypothetical protein